MFTSNLPGGIGLVESVPKNHLIRRGLKDDRPTGMLAAKDATTLYVLLCDDQQVGAVDANHLGGIAFLKIFEEYQGVRHSEIFLELIEEEARQAGVKSITTLTPRALTPTFDQKMIRAFEKCGFILAKKDSNGDFWYCKDL